MQLSYFFNQFLFCIYDKLNKINSYFRVMNNFNARRLDEFRTIKYFKQNLSP